MVKHKLVSFAAAVALWTLVTLLIKLICKLLKWKHTYKTKIMLFLPLCCKSEAILSKKFRPGYPWAVMFIWENFHLGYRDLGSKNRDLRSRASPVSHVNISIF